MRHLAGQSNQARIVKHLAPMVAVLLFQGKPRNATILSEQLAMHWNYVAILGINLASSTKPLIRRMTEPCRFPKNASASSILSSTAVKPRQNH